MLTRDSLSCQRRLHSIIDRYGGSAGSSWTGGISNHFLCSYFLFNCRGSILWLGFITSESWRGAGFDVFIGWLFLIFVGKEEGRTTGLSACWLSAKGSHFGGALFFLFSFCRVHCNRLSL